MRSSGYSLLYSTKNVVDWMITLNGLPNSWMRECPTGLTKTQQRRVQKVWAQEVREEKKEAKRDAWFNEVHTMSPSTKMKSG
jgi:hypothetical protein